MNKTELIAAMAEKTGKTKKDCEAVLSAMTATIQDELVKGERVQFVGFGTFETRSRPARTAKNPRTGGTMKIAASKVPAFKAGKALKDACN